MAGRGGIRWRLPANCRQPLAGALLVGVTGSSESWPLNRREKVDDCDRRLLAARWRVRLVKLDYSPSRQPRERGTQVQGISLLLVRRGVKSVCSVSLSDRATELFVRLWPECEVPTGSANV